MGLPGSNIFCRNDPVRIKIKICIVIYSCSSSTETIFHKGEVIKIQNLITPCVFIVFVEECITRNKCNWFCDSTQFICTVTHTLEELGDISITLNLDVGIVADSFNSNLKVTIFSYINRIHLCPTIIEYYSCISRYSAIQ